ncbi:hypothetical protein [uncultured Croceitalea sp.]|uniref:hypothetical protein n=1 Tax=uncultured Croceitalea sp. TaxID=1798908 RepID=UPI00374EEC06
MKEENFKQPIKVEVRLKLDFLRREALNRSTDFTILKDELHSFLRSKYFGSRKRESRYANKNLIYDVINLYVKKHFFKNSYYEIVLGDYREKEGSVIGLFTLVVIGTINNYSVFSDNLERFIQDLQYVFNEGFHTEIEYKEIFPNPQNTNQPSSNSVQVFSSIRKSQLPKTILLISAFVIALAGVFDDQLFSDKSLPYPIQYQSHSYVDEDDIEDLLLEEKEKSLYHVYDEVIKEELRKAIVDQDTLRIEFLRNLQAEMNIEKAKMGIVESISSRK